MRKAVIAMMAFGFLAACGADGEPVKPVFSGSQTFGVNSKTGTFTKSQLGVCFGNAC